MVEELEFSKRLEWSKKDPFINKLKEAGQIHKIIFISTLYKKLTLSESCEKTCISSMNLTETGTFLRDTEIKTRKCNFNRIVF